MEHHPGGPPLIDGFHIWHRKYSNLAYATFILFCNLAIPCIVFYCLRDYTSLSYQALIGIASGSLGISSSFDGPFRMWKLWKHRDLYGPLKDENRWHMDFTMHVYSLALFVFAVPLAVSSALNPPLKNFFNMSTPMLVLPIAIVFLISLLRPRIPFWLSSDEPGSRMKPAMFYMFEDIGAVDFRHGRPFRAAVNERFNASPPFQSLMVYLTWFWAIGAFIYTGCVSAVNWTATFDFAFGFILGLFFVWLISWGILSIFIVKWGLRREEKWWAARKTALEGGAVADPEKVMRTEPGAEGKAAGALETAATKVGEGRAERTQMTRGLSERGSGMGVSRNMSEASSEHTATES